MTWAEALPAEPGRTVQCRESVHPHPCAMESGGVANVTRRADARGGRTTPAPARRSTSAAGRSDLSPEQGTPLFSLHARGSRKSRAGFTSRIQRPRQSETNSNPAGWGNRIKFWCGSRLRICLGLWGEGLATLSQRPGAVSGGATEVCSPRAFPKKSWSRFCRRRRRWGVRSAVSERRIGCDCVSAESELQSRSTGGPMSLRESCAGKLGQGFELRGQH